MMARALASLGLVSAPIASARRLVPVTPCGTDFSCLSTYGLTAMEREMSTPPTLHTGAWDHYRHCVTDILINCCNKHNHCQILFLSKNKINLFGFNKSGRHIRRTAAVWQQCEKFKSFSHLLMVCQHIISTEQRRFLLVSRIRH